MSASRSERAEVETGGLRAPRPPFGRLIFRLVALVVVGGGVIAVAVLLGQLPADTAPGSLVLRGLVGLGIGVVVLWISWRVLRALTEPPPPPPDLLDAREVDVVYECAVCGTRLRLEVAATGKAPRHCGEEMEPTVG